MIFLVTAETAIADVTTNARVRLAQALQIQPSMVIVEWAFNKAGDLEADIHLELPPILPPSELDMGDPVAVEAWERSLGDLPTLDEFMRGKDMGDWQATVKRHGKALMNSAASFLRAIQYGHTQRAAAKLEKVEPAALTHHA